MNYFLSNPPVYTLPGTWSNSVNYTGLSDIQMMITMHSILVPLVIIVGAYYLYSISDNKSKKV
tara:strand:+ start:315 stop:503 length:189 start_codon:yes stop_codon:yes gene_type:complete